MSLAVDFLSEFFARGEINQTDFARSAGMTPTNVTDLLKGDVLISGRNLDKLLRGLRSERDRRDFLTAYLRDQIPADYADDIAIQLRQAPTGTLAEGDETNNLEAQMMIAFASLPSGLYRKRIVRFLQQLRGDGKLRDLFVRTVAYLEDEKGSGLAPETLKNPPIDELAGAGASPAGRQVKRLLRGRKGGAPSPQLPKPAAPGSDGAAKH